MFLKIVRDQLERIINDIDVGNSNASECEEEEILELISRLTNKKEKLSKYQSIKYINDSGIKMSRATFDNYVKDGKLPKSRHQAGFKELFWYKEDFDDFIDKKKNSNELLK